MNARLLAAFLTLTLASGGAGCFLDGDHDRGHDHDGHACGAATDAGEPTADPLLVDGHEWTKIGWSAYDVAAGFGWSGPFIGDANIMLYQYLADAPVDDLFVGAFGDRFAAKAYFTATAEAKQAPRVEI